MLTGRGRTSNAIEVLPELSVTVWRIRHQEIKIYRLWHNDVSCTGVHVLSMLIRRPISADAYILQSWVVV